MSAALFCTVGGSHQPIIKAIRELVPDFVVFVCSEDDPATLKKGSWVQVEGEGMVIKASPKEENPTLPNIPTQLGLARERYAVLRVPADNFDTIYDRVRREMQSRRRQGARIMADYTGGTKTMSAALAVAALDEGAELHVVTGARPDLDRVREGTESVKSAPVGIVRFRREIERALAPWRRHAYAEAEAFLARLHPPSQQEWEKLHVRARVLSRAFAFWDAFAHEQARDALEMLRDLLARSGHADLVSTLQALTGDGNKSEALRIADLWRNAERRAAAERFDDAVARWYRMVEWVAQWLLRTRAGIATADVPPEKALEGMQPGPDGRIRVGLMDAWRLAATLADRGDDVAGFWNEHANAVRDLVQLRNGSVLAHGFHPLDRQAWAKVEEWTEKHFLPWWKGVTGIRKLPAQLPNDGEAFLESLDRQDRHS